MTNFLMIIKTVIYVVILCSSVSIWHEAVAGALSQLKIQNQYTPPPIPVVNTPSFKNYVKKFHTFPSPYGYEPYRNSKGQPISFLLSELNSANPYIPVTLTCNSHDSCPFHVVIKDNQVVLNSRDSRLIYFIRGQGPNHKLPRAIIGFYFPNDPKFYTRPALAHFTGDIKFGDPIVTILFSQRVLKQISEKNQAFFEVRIEERNKARDTIHILSPFVSGNENLSIGTTLYVIGLGQASGVEFTERVSQTTGETYTKQVQTSFSLNLNLQYEMTVGGGIFPVSETVRLGVNKTLTSLIGNELAINNQNTISRSYTIKPGINDTYYWAIYQLGYSHRINAPDFERVLNRVQKAWKNRVRLTIADNHMTQDGKPVGNILPPQTSGLRNDVTVGVAVPINPQAKQGLYAETMQGN